MACLANADAPDAYPGSNYDAIRNKNDPRSRGHAFTQNMGSAPGVGWWKCDFEYLAMLKFWSPWCGAPDEETA